MIEGLPILRATSSRWVEVAIGDLPAELGGFYRELAAAEEKHHLLFLQHASGIIGEEKVAKRVMEIAELEGEIVGRLPLEPRIH